MELPQYEIILYVADQEKSRDLYSSILNMKPALDVPGMTEFRLSPALKLGLMPEKGIVKILSDKTPHPASGNGIPRCELYIAGDDASGSFERAIRSGAREVSPVQARDWGDTVGYVCDDDGHIIAFAEKTAFV
jgi:hypothetical protein